ncbi:MAG TPA: HEAT repeat domain-containing protein [Planctomycetaceae bacterium]|nr:HEAT repeat domain-containing protein [Planctomycetaceae bacterium]
MAPVRIRTSVLILALFAGGYALAQPEVTKGPRPSAAKAAPAGAKPAPSGAAPSPAGGPAPTAGPGGAPQPAPPPAEESPLLTEPTTPVEVFDAAVLCDRLYRPILAKQYLDKFLKSNPSDAVLLEVRDKYGPALFLRFAHNPDLQPAGGRVADLTTAATRRRSEDTTYLDSLIRNLGGPPEDRDTAQEMLDNIGPTVIPRMLQHVAAPQGTESAEVLVQSIVRMGQKAVPVLLGALESNNDTVRIAGMQALGYLGAKTAVPYLLVPAFDDHEPAGIRYAARMALSRILGLPTEKGDGPPSLGAAAELRRIARNALANRIPWPTTDGLTDLWTWNDQTKSVIDNRLPPAVASAYTALRFSRQALALSPEDPETQALVVASDFAWRAQAKGERGSLVSPNDTALAVGPDVLADALTLGLKLGNPAVSVGALRALAAVGVRHQLYGSQAPRSPVLAALNDPNPDVQYAAAVAILQSQPDRRFRGSQRVVEILTRAISGTHSPFAVVIDSNRERANETAGLLTRIGFEAVTAFTGREGFELAADRANVVLVAVHANVVRWPLSQTLSNLRADARTAQIPIVIYGPESVRQQVAGALTHYPLIDYLSESSTEARVESQVGPFLKRALALAETPANREQKIAEATAWLAQIARSNRTDIFPLDLAENPLMGLSTDRATSVNAMAALAAIPRGDVQRHFAQLASTDRFDPTIRLDAAHALIAHIQRFGLLLSRSEVAQLESAWHDASSPELATALSAAVGMLKPNPKRVASRLQSIAVPAVPAP